MSVEPIEIDSDEATEIQDIEQLNAVLASDKPTFTETVSQPSALSPISFTGQNYLRPTYQKLSTAIALNKATDERLQQLETCLISKLNQCRTKLSEIHNEWLEPYVESYFNYLICGKPYFKDRNYFPTPDNNDAMLMTKNDMCDFSLLTSISGWTIKDKTDFLSLLLKMSQNIRKNSILKEIECCEKQLKKEENDKLKTKIAVLNAELKDIKNKELKDIALPIKEDYDWEAIAVSANSRHKAEEYRALWKLFFHPSINKSTWTKMEHYRLQKIAFNYNLQQWEKIALELDTGRTGYQCFVYFRGNMNHVGSGQKWTEEETEYVKRLIEYHREDSYIPWGKVAACMENKTKIQVYNKYMRLIEQRKGRFLKEEDAVILACVEKFGKDYKKVTEYLPGRSMSQVRVRHQLLAKRTSVVWTVEEDKRLIKLMAKQDADTNFAGLTMYFRDKDRMHLRARYLTLFKFMKRHPNADICRAPRRSARHLDHGEASVTLSSAVAKLTEKMKSEVVDIKKKKVSFRSQEEEIEKAIVSTLIIENEAIERNAGLELEPEPIDDEEESRHEVNIINLRKVLTMLRSSLQKQKFKQCYYASDYPDLLEEVNKLTQKTYSRKRKIVWDEEAPNIWGGNMLGPLVYVLPPNFITIIGCKKLMEYVNMNAKKKRNVVENNVKFLNRKNPFFKKAYEKFMDRFRTIFLWPMILSNEVPKAIK